ncbi:MAG: metallophosphoesterase [Candidatus Protistobacter heckmanni]|nr:metallophosphoesterase [Candidatus Protistobacter heckmanni]MCS6763707.1 metallophosphoesterase [Candidatus Protistobacter heckmanni]
MPRRGFILTVLSLITLLHVYIGWRILPDLPVAAAFKALGAAWLAASVLLIPVGLLSRFVARQPLADPLADPLAWVGMLAMGLFSSLLALTLLRDLGLGTAALLGGAGEAALAWSAALALGLAALTTLIGLINARRLAGVVEVDVQIAWLPPGLHGFTIAQISDIHVGPTIKRGYLQRIVDRVNALGADLIAVTGDLVDGSVGRLAPHTEPLAGLQARHGAYFVTGNHEYYSSAHEWIVEVRRLGLTVLMNEHVLLAYEGESLLVAGVADYSAHQFDETHRSDPHKAMANGPARMLGGGRGEGSRAQAPSGAEAQTRHGSGSSASRGGDGAGRVVGVGARLLLAHQPRSAFAAAEAGFDLQISGHTHGGQFCPWNFFVPMQQPFTAGLNRLRELWVYTSRGTGYWGPPKRFLAPSEITRLRLVAA